MINLLAIFIGGGLGSLARFGVGKLTTSFFNSDFPLGTLLANVLSCVILAVAVGIFSAQIFSNSTLRFLVLTGFAVASAHSPRSVMKHWIYSAPEIICLLC